MTNNPEVSPAMTADCKYCGKPIGRGLGIFKDKWYHVNKGDSSYCPNKKVFPLPVRLPASPVADQMDSAKSADLLAFPEKSKDDPVGFENAIMRQIFLSGYSQALEDHGLPPCEPITVAEAERGIKRVGDRTPVAEGES